MLTSSSWILSLLTAVGVGVMAPQSSIPPVSLPIAPSVFRVVPMVAQGLRSSTRLPKAIKTQLIQAMQQELNGSSQDFKVLKVEKAKWLDCSTDINQPKASVNCQSTRQTGFRVQISGKGETWIYYATRNGTIQLDGPASVSPRAYQTLLNKLGYDPTVKLKILAAKPMGILPPCPPNALCKPLPIPHWQLLLEQQPRPLTLDLQGKIATPSPLKSLLPKTLHGLSPSWAEAVLHDVRDRHLGLLPSNLSVESIRPSIWAACNSGGETAPGPGPSQPITGACMIGRYSGWQIMTRSGPVVWIHYLQTPGIPEPRRTLANLVAPDGPQSLPPSVADAVRNAAAKEDQKPVNQYRVHWAESQFFDGCLNASQFLVTGATVDSTLRCGQTIQSGWQVQVMSRGESGNFQLSVYHTTLTGNELRFISKGDWFPPPIPIPSEGL